MDKVSWGLPSVSWRRILLLSITLNVGLLSRVIFQKGGLSTLTIPTKTQRFEGFLSEKNTRETKMTGVPERAAHGSENDISFSTRRTEAQDSGDRRSINLQHGDPKMFEGFWQKVGDEGTIVIPGWQSMSYFSDIRNICWFLEPGFAKEVIRLHNLVGNAVTEDRHIVVGTGSTQLFQAALYALSPPDASLPINVVSAVPYYSSYPLVTDYLKSGLFKWAGDAYNFDKDEPYIELVCSPNNPDGHVRQAVVDKSGGMLVHDLAYYWPQYTPITSPADYDIMLFTASKTTGHAGIRIGWALVKDKEVAKQMTKFIELNTIGVSKDSQLRAAKILQVISGSCQNLDGPKYAEDFFQHTRHLMTERWQKLRDAARKSGLFSLPEFHPGHCNYFNEVSESHPAFAWLRCEGDIEDCENFLRSHMILTRSGKYFGADMKYVRVSMLDNEETFSLFVDRLSNIRL